MLIEASLAAVANQCFGAEMWRLYHLFSGTVERIGHRILSPPFQSFFVHTALSSWCCTDHVSQGNCARIHLCHPYQVKFSSMISDEFWRKHEVMSQQ